MRPRARPPSPRGRSRGARARAPEPPRARSRPPRGGCPCARYRWRPPDSGSAVSRRAPLDRALALAALDLVGLGAVPVDEVEEVVRAELDRQLQVRDQRLELLRPGAVHELVEGLAVVSLLLVVADPALDSVGDPLRRQPRLEPMPEGDVVVLPLAPDVGDVGGDRVIADLDRGPVEADRADVVLAAPVRAAAHLDLNLLGERVGDLHLLDPRVDRAIEAHRARDAQLAAIGTGAADHVRDREGTALAEPELLEAGPDVVDRLLPDPAQDEVLLHRGPGVPAAELAHDRRETPELLRAEVPAGHLDGDRDEPLLPLRLHVLRDERVELGAVPVGRAVGLRDGRRVRLLVMDEHEVIDGEVALVDPIALELLVDQLAERVHPDLVDQH